MKKFIFPLLIMTVWAACTPEKSGTELDKLKEERDSLSQVQKEVSLRLKAIEGQLMKLDSNKKVATVTAIDVEPKDFRHFFRVYGIVESNQSISLYAETSGKINSIRIKRGQHVAKGQLLAEIDSKILHKNIEEIKTSLELAEKLYNKQSKLWLEENIGSEVQYLEAKNNKESLEKKLATLQAQLALTRVRAPFSGVIDEIFPKVGEMASPQMPMFRLVNLSDVYLTASISEAYVGKVLSGTKAMVEFSSLGTKLESEVVRVGSYINPDNRTFNVNIALKKDNNFKPNMMASVDIEDYSVDSAIVVPSRLIMENTSGQSYVYVYENPASEFSKVKKVNIIRGVSYDGETEVLEGLTSDLMVVDKGSRSVKDGQRVKLVVQ